MQTLSQVLKMAVASNQNPIITEALKSLDSAQTSREISSVLDWIDSQLSSNS